MSKIVLVVLVVVLCGCVGDPLATEIPNSVQQRHVNKEFRSSVLKLEDEERDLLNQFFVGWDETGGGSFPEGFTIGAAIDAQRRVYLGMWGSSGN